MKYTLAKVVTSGHDASFQPSEGRVFHYPTSGAVEERNYDPSPIECSTGLHVTIIPEQWKHSGDDHVLEVTVEDEDIITRCPHPQLYRGVSRLGVRCCCQGHQHSLPDKLRVKKLTVVRCLTCGDIRVRQRTFTRSFIRLGGTLEGTS